MTEVELGEEPTIEQNLNPTLGDSDNKAGGVGAKPKNITASVIGGRLQLSADVAVDEIDALKEHADEISGNSENA